MRWIDNMEIWIGMFVDKLLREIRDKGRWCRLVHEATNSWSENG